MLMLLAPSTFLDHSCMHVGGAFKLELFLPEDYPMAAPKVQAQNTDSWHIDVFYMLTLLT